MARIIVYFLFVFLVLTCSTLSNAAENDKKAKDKSVTSTIDDDTKEIKNEFNKTKVETKEAIVRDVKALKEQVPKDIKEVKQEFIKKSSEVKATIAQELKEIRESLSKPLTPAKPGKNN